MQQRKQSGRRRAEADDTQPPSELMSLPAELRNRIWTYLFEDSIQELHGSGYTTYGMEGNWKYCSKPPHLLLTCQQLYTEAIGIYYSSSTFFGKITAHKKSADKFKTWMRTIGIERASLIKNVRFFVSGVYEHLHDIDCKAYYDWEYILEAAVLLETIKAAAASVHSGGLCVYGNLWYYDQKKGFEIWTPNPHKTNNEARQAYEQGTEAFESWLAGASANISCWQIGSGPGVAELEHEHWREELLDSFDKWYMEKYSATAEFVCGCDRRSTSSTKIMAAQDRSDSIDRMGGRYVLADSELP
ncbi:hypothetical protein CBER1_04086 [Cercospora berteroae]|uniref:Uncharacterized protein n=1 Tax=Cercospora berteroae TaxID=357750 RepID=A0A2S6CGS7_9PEZI|nr:hypothetical protein CBER1_04086 [Cercospora berteroae]